MGVTFEELLTILVCPACRSRVTLQRQTWLVCDNPACRRKYPVRDGIPIMLVEEGDRYVDVPVEALEPLGPVPE
ncbi:MAG: Trm112 family protein [Firmicutes bacterium]|nr:Trm112 family protein [Bacillota bacterium]